MRDARRQGMTTAIDLITQLVDVRPGERVEYDIPNTPAEKDELIGGLLYLANDALKGWAGCSSLVSGEETTGVDALQQLAPRALAWATRCDDLLEFEAITATEATP